MKSKLFLSAVFFISLTSKSDIEFNVGPQKYTEAQKDEMATCRKHWRKDLAVCMEKHMKDKKIFRMNLLFLDKVGQRENYFEQTLKSAEDYKKLEHMYDDNDWIDLWSTMSDDEKKQFFKQDDIILIASSKDNLKAFIKNKENQEWWYSLKRNTDIGATVVVVGGSILVFTPVGPWVIGAAKTTISALSTKTAVGAAA